jgi:ribosomal protein S27AE
MRARTREPEVLLTRSLSHPPQVCPKPYCGGTSFLRHEEGWQCLNCMKIIYREQAVVSPAELPELTAAAVPAWEAV